MPRLATCRRPRHVFLLGDAVMGLLLSAWFGVTGVNAGYAELIEINHCCDDDGAEKFVQLIAWDWSPDYLRWHAQQWAIVTEWDVAKKLVVASDYHGKPMSCRFTFYRETWTRHDPEVENRKLFGTEHRRRVW